MLLDLKLKIELVKAKQPKYQREIDLNTGFKSKCEIMNKLEVNYLLHDCTGILDY